MKLITYLTYCRACKKRTEHIPIFFSKRRGVLLRCVCGFRRTRYSNLQKIKEYKAEPKDGETISPSSSAKCDGFIHNSSSLAQGSSEVKK